MKLYVVEKQSWTIVTCLKGKSCGLLDWLDGLASSYEKNVNAMYALFERAAKVGPNSLGDKLCHSVDKDEGIFEFTKGDLRVLWFYGHDRIILCSHGFIKKSQKTPSAHKESAKRVKQEYEAAYAAGKVVLVDDED